MSTMKMVKYDKGELLTVVNLNILDAIRSRHSRSHFRGVVVALCKDVPVLELLAMVTESVVLSVLFLRLEIVRYHYKKV